MSAVATLTEEDAVAVAHEQPEEMELAEAEAEPGAKEPSYRIFCVSSGDYIEYEPLSTVPLTSLKQAKARLKRIDTNGLCVGGDHWIEKTNALGLWERYVGKKVGGVTVSSRGLEIVIPANPNAPARPRRDDGVELTASDFFCGGGGSSTGIQRVPGMRVVMAVNHWDLAIATHNHNLPGADHDQANVAEADPRRYPTTDIGWFSPECTKWSQASGKKVDYDTKWRQTTLENLFDPDSADHDTDEPEPDEATQRSRMLMGDVIRMSLYHLYKGVIVENVTDILAWAYLPDWLKKMHDMGYDHKVVVLNSAFANQMGMAPPQLRDRVYFVFWLRKYSKPNFAKWLRPKCWCDGCFEIVEGIYSPLPGKPRAMRFGAQYHYRCPKLKCRGRVVKPFAVPAKAVINPTLPTQPIADRKKPLQPNTYDRVDAGLEKWGPYLLAAIAGNTFERRPGVRTYPIGGPAPTQTTTNTLGMVQPVGGSWNTDAHLTDLPMRAQTTTETNALVVPLEGRTGVQARTTDDQLRAQTARHQDAIVQAPGEMPGQESLIVALRNNGVAAPADQASFPTFAANGTHHAIVVPMRNGSSSNPADTTPLPAQTTVQQLALVMRNNTARGHAGQMTTPDEEPIRALTTAGHQSVLQLDGIYQYDTGLIRHVTDQMPSQTTRGGDALLRGAGMGRLRPEDCTLRMLAVEEIQGSMDFPPWFQLLGKAKRSKVKMLGNAVTPNAAAVLMALLFEAITGIEQERFDFDPFAPLW